MEIKTEYKIPPTYKKWTHSVEDNFNKAKYREINLYDTTLGQLHNNVFFNGHNRLKIHHQTPKIWRDTFDEVHNNDDTSLVVTI